MSPSRVLIGVGIMLAGGCGLEPDAELELAPPAEVSLEGDSRLDCIDCTQGDDRETGALDPRETESEGGAIIAMSDTNYVPAPSDHPSPVILSGKLFVTSKPQLVLDADQDFQFDYLEHEIAEKVAPLMQWSQYENARQPHE